MSKKSWAAVALKELFDSTRLPYWKGWATDNVEDGNKQRKTLRQKKEKLKEINNNVLQIDFKWDNKHIKERH